MYTGTFMIKLLSLDLELDELCVYTHTVWLIIKIICVHSVGSAGVLQRSLKISKKQDKIA